MRLSHPAWPLLLVLPVSSCSSRLTDIDGAPGTTLRGVALLRSFPAFATVGSGRADAVPGGLAVGTGVRGETRGGGLVRITSPSRPQAWLEFEEVDAAPARPTATEGVVVLRDLRVDTDVFRFAVASGVEEVRVLRTAQAPLTVEWKVRSGPDVASVTVVGDSIRVLDRSGHIVVTTEPMWAVDSTGLKRNVQLSQTPAGTFSLTLDASGMTYPIAIDPTWASGGTLTGKRSQHTATRLLDGRVLIAGGYSDAGGTVSLSTAEVFDPKTDTWSATGPMATARRAHVASLLPDGRVLVAAGATGTGSKVTNAEVWSPSTGTWTATTGALPSSAGGWNATALLVGGKVLMVGGNDGTGSGVSTVLKFDPAA